MARGSQLADSAAAHGLWHQLGMRLQNRRVLLGMSQGAVAAYLGVPRQTYVAFEAGDARIPAALLSQVSDLFKVPLYYFFQDLSFVEHDVEAGQLDEPPVFSVATTEQRMAALIRDFLSADLEAQCLLLLLARSFATNKAAT